MAASRRRAPLIAAVAAAAVLWAVLPGQNAGGFVPATLLAQRRGEAAGEVNLGSGAPEAAAGGGGASALLAGGPGSTSVLRAIGATAAVQVGSRVIRHRRARKTKELMYESKARMEKFNPEPLLKFRDIRSRLGKVHKLRREDVVLAEKAKFADFREKRWQVDVATARKIYEEPGYKSMERIRTELGMPMPPINKFADAVKQMNEERQSQMRQTRAIGTGGAAEPKKKKKVEPLDMDAVNQEFMEQKGVKQSRKQIAAKQARQKAKQQ